MRIQENSNSKNLNKINNFPKNEEEKESKSSTNSNEVSDRFIQIKEKSIIFKILDFVLWNKTESYDALMREINNNSKIYKSIEQMSIEEM